jgi:hypothetical protein
VDWIAAAGFPLERIPRSEWQARIFEEARRSPESALFPLGHLVAERPGDHGAAPDAGPGPRRPRWQFDCSNITDGLAGTSIACPHVDARLIETAFARFVDTGFLPAPQTLVSQGGMAR